MPTPSHLLAFALVALALIVIPGPSVLFVIGRSIALGRVGGLLSVAGNALGGAVLVVLVALELGPLLAASDLLFTVVKLAGAAYFVHLGIQAIRHRRAAGGITAGPAPGRPRTLLRQGFVVGISNPKTAVFFAAVLPQFVEVRAGAVPLQLAVLGLVFVALALLSDGVWAIAAGSARAWFARSPRRIERLSAAGGVTMIGLGGTLALSSRSA